MKRLARTLFLAGVVMVMLCVTAMAADEPKEAGMQGLQVIGSDVTVAPSNESGAITADSSSFYAGADRLTVTVSSPDNTAQYLVLALNDDSKLPKEGNIVYIDQTAGADGVTFTVYPSQLVSGKTYHIYITSNSDTDSRYNTATLTEVASFQYYAPYTLGDVNGDNIIDTTDAALAIQHAVELQVLTGNKFLAADVNRDNLVDVLDASQMLRYFLQIIQGF